MEKEINSLKNDKEKKYKELMLRFRNLEKEHLMQGIENEKLKRKIKELKKEIETYEKIPQILATIVDILEDGNVAIRGTVGHTLIVGYPESIDEELLIPGARVALNEHTMSIVKVYPDEKDTFEIELYNWPKVSSLDFGNDIFYSGQIERIEYF